MDGNAQLSPAEILEVLLCPDGSDEGTLHIDERFKLVKAWERERGLPDFRWAKTILEMRGGDAIKMYYNLVKRGLEGKNIVPSGDEDEDAEDFVKRSPKRLRHVASPMSKQPSAEEREAKKNLEQLAWAHRDTVVAKAKQWLDDFKLLEAKLNSQGMVPERNEYDVVQACTDRGAAIKAGKKKAADARLEAAKQDVVVKRARQGSEVVDTKELIQLRADLAKAKQELTSAAVEKAQLKERVKSLDTTNISLQGSLTELNSEKQTLFQYLCKEETKTGRLEGELHVLRSMFYKKKSAPRPLDGATPGEDTPANTSRSESELLSPSIPGGSQPAPSLSSQFMNRSM